MRISKENGVVHRCRCSAEEVTVSVILLKTIVDFSTKHSIQRQPSRVCGVARLCVCGASEFFQIDVSRIHLLTQLQQDHAGNIYICRTGRDRELGGIALTFSLDAPSLSVPGAFQSFQKLADSKLECDVILLGWTSPGGELVGRDVWDGSLQASEAWEKYPDLQAFAGEEDVSTFALSAIFDVQQTEDAGATASGSPVLITALQKEVPTVKVKDSSLTSKRAPVISIRGRDAVQVCTKTVTWYSEYVAALFGNFD